MTDFVPAVPDDLRTLVACALRLRGLHVTAGEDGSVAVPDLPVPLVELDRVIGRTMLLIEAD